MGNEQIKTVSLEYNIFKEIPAKLEGLRTFQMIGAFISYMNSVEGTEYTG